MRSHPCYSPCQQRIKYRLRLVRVRIGLPRAIGADDRGEVGVAKEQRVVALVGLEI